QEGVCLARSPGRTTVVIESPQSGKKGAPSATRSWAAATWGEHPHGKSWMRVNAYGLSQNLEGGKAYHLWMVPQSGDPVDVGAIEIDQNGNGYATKSDLPAVDQGKS